MTNSSRNTIIIPDDDDDDVKCIGSNFRNHANSATSFSEIPQSSRTDGTRQSVVFRDSTEAGRSSNYISNLAIRPSPQPSPKVSQATQTGFQKAWEFPTADRNGRRPAGSKPSPPFQSAPRTPSPHSRLVEASVDGGSSRSSGKRKRPRAPSIAPDQCQLRRTHSAHHVLTAADTFTSSTSHSQSSGDEHSIFHRYRSPTVQELENVVVEVPCDEDDEVFEISNGQLRAVPRNRTARRITGDYLVIDLDESEDILEKEALTIEVLRKGSRAGNSFKAPRRNEPIDSHWTLLKDLETSHGILRSGKVVELKSGDFLYITVIMINPQTAHKILRGYSLQRSRDLNGMLPRKVNELCWRFDIDLDDSRQYLDQNMVDQDLDQVVKLRHLRITNNVFPASSFRETGGFSDVKHAEQEAPCTARWRFCSVYPTAMDRLDKVGNRWQERSLEHIRFDDHIFRTCRSKFLVDDAEIRRRYRGKTILGGSSIAFKKHTTKQPAREMVNSDQRLIDLTAEDKPRGFQVKVSPSIDLSGSDLVTPPNNGIIHPGATNAQGSANRGKFVRAPGQRYTYGDCFCGAGGATRGASMAGLKIIWGFDKDQHACTSWQLNFPKAHMYTLMAHEFVLEGQGNDQLRVDIMHLSPPCQVWSPAHTTPGRDDEMNLASLYACGSILKAVKPRIATLEQTFGIVSLSRFQAYFRSLILMFTDNGYSVRWKVALLQNWGLPQQRRRLIMIASCPGELLPDFPPFTHADPKNNNGELKPWTSVNSVLRCIPYDTENHNIEEAMSRGLHEAPWSGDSIAPRCITTHGGQNYHPSGKRPFTDREFAALQGFPHCHRFSSVNVKKQIGNAVPPTIAKVLFEAIKKALERVDGVEPEHITID